jgi:hypothetical protein
MQAVEVRGIDAFVQRGAGDAARLEKTAVGRDLTVVGAS